MLSLIIPGTKVKLESCELDSVRKAMGGKLIIKHLPYYPPIDCTQDCCDEFAEFVIALITADSNEDMMCTLCPGHLSTLLKLQELEVPVILRH